MLSQSSYASTSLPFELVVSLSLLLYLLILIDVLLMLVAMTGSSLLEA